MQKELINQAVKMFNASEKWNSFLELSNRKEEIRNQWFQTLKTSVTKRFCEDDVVNGWSFSSWGIWDCRWYLTEYGRESFCIWMCAGNKIALWANPSFHDSQQITNLLNTDKYSIIMSVLRPDEVFTGDWKLVECGNFDFESPYNGHLDPDRLAWFAGNETEKLTEQIVEKINRVRKNEAIFELFSEINRLTKK